MRTKVRYHLFRNTYYALAGLRDMAQNERSFQLELVVFICLQLTLFFLTIPFAGNAVLRLSLFIPLIAEAINSAIERTVDLVTLEYHEMAKRAKDAGSAIVFLSILLTALIWACTLYYYYGN